MHSGGDDNPQDEAREKEEQETRMIVEEERRRMLAQNVERLIGHIPKGVLSEVITIITPRVSL